MKKENKLTLGLFVIYLIILTWIILFKFQFSVENLPHLRSINLIPFKGTVSLFEVLINVIIFIPVGLYTTMLSPDRALWKKILPAFLVSLLYEVLQFIFAIGATDITDVIGNTFGGIIGIGIALLFFKIFKTNTNRILNILAVVFTILFVGFLIYFLYFSGVRIKVH